MPLKIWTSTEKSDDKIIAISDEYIYKGNPPASEIESAVFDLQMKGETLKHFFTIPLRYIIAINQQEGKKYIEVLFRGDTEHLKIQNDTKRQEIFDYFKNTIANATLYVSKQSKFQAIKKPLIAMAVLTGLFIWSLYIAVQVENGAVYDVTGENYFSVAGIILLIASLGVTKLIITYASLLTIAGISMIKKYKNPVIKNMLILKR